jgi:hypothetical protein
MPNMTNPVIAPERQGRSTSNGNRMETRINQEIRLFRQIEEVQSGQGLVVSDDDPDFPVLIGWHKSGVFDANSGQGPDGLIFFAPTLSQYGRELFEKRLNELEESTSVGFIKKHRFKFYAWFFGLIVAPVMVWLVIELIKKNA